MLTLKQAKNLQPGDMLEHTINKNKDNTPQRWKVNGKPKTWVTMPERVKVPLKNGLRNFAYLTEADLHIVNIQKYRGITYTDTPTGK